MTIKFREGEEKMREMASTKILDEIEGEKKEEEAATKR